MTLEQRLTKAFTEFIDGNDEVLPSDLAGLAMGLLRQGPCITVYWERISDDDTWAWEPLIDDNAGLVATRWDFPDADPPNTTTKPLPYAVVLLGDAGSQGEPA